MKKIAIAIITIMIFCGGALWYLGAIGLNQFIKGQIEIQGSKVTGNTVSVDEVEIALAKGSMNIKGLTLANSEGFNHPHLFSLKSIALDIDTKLKEPYTIEQFVIQNPEFFIEVTETGDSNIQKLYAQLNKHNGSKTSAPDEPGKASADPLVKVEKLLVEGVTLQVDLTRLGNKVHRKNLPTIDLGSIGGEQGIPASQMGVEVMKKLTDAIVKKVKAEQKDHIKDGLLDKAKDKLMDLFG